MATRIPVGGPVWRAFVPLAVMVAASLASAAEKPNVLLILADDK